MSKSKVKTVFNLFSYFHGIVKSEFIPEF